MNADDGKIWYGIGLDTTQLQAGAGKSTRIFAGIGDAAEAESSRISNSFGRIATAAGGIFAAQQVLTFGKTMVDVRGKIEAYEISFETLLGSAEKGKAVFSELKDYAVNTPLLLGDLASGAQMLLSFNVEAEKVMPILKQIGDISMGDASKFNSLTLAFSQMYSTGKLMGQDLLQMINAGFNPLTVISEKTGKSIGQLKKEMESGAISAGMVADAFASATGEGGKFHGMLEKQSKGINGMISNLQGAVDDMFNDLGTKSQGAISTAIGGATELVKHYEAVGAALGALAGMYGIYKTALIAHEVFYKSANKAKYIAETLAEGEALKSLETAEIRGQLVKQGLKAGSVEYAAALKAEVLQKQEAQKAAYQLAASDAAAAQTAYKAALQRSLAAKQSIWQRETDLALAQAEGSQTRINLAKSELQVALDERAAASKAKKAIAAELANKNAAKEVALSSLSATRTALDTAATDANTAAKSLGAKVTGLLTVATQKLSATLMSNVWTLALAAVVALGYGIYKLITYQTDAEKWQGKLNERFREFTAQTTAEQIEIDRLFGKLDAARKGTKEYDQAKQSILDKYGSHLKGMGDEIERLNDVAGAYRAISAAAKQAATDRAISDARSEATDTYKEKQTEHLADLKKAIGKKVKNERDAEALYQTIVHDLREGNTLSDEAYNIVQSLTETKWTRGADGVNRASFKNPVDDAVEALKNDNKSIDAAFADIEKQFGLQSNDYMQMASGQIKQAISDLQEQLGKAEKEGTSAIAIQLDLAKAKEALLRVSEQENKHAETVSERKLRWTKELAEAEKKLAELKADNSTATEEEIKIRQEEVDKLKKSLGLDKTALGATNKTAVDKNRQKVEMAERQRQIAEYERKMAEQNAQGELELRQVKIDLLKEGNAKELAQINLNYDKLIAANRQREAEMVKELQESERLDWENKNPKFKDKGLVFTPQKTAADLTAAQRERLKEYTQIANTYKENAEADLLKKLLNKYRSFEQQRTDINKQFEAERKVIENSGKSQSDKDSAISVLEKKRREEIKAVNDEEVESMQKSSDLLVKLFADASQKSVKELRSIINTTEELLTYLEQTNSADITPKFGFSAEELKTLKESPEKLKALREAIKGLNGELGSRSPFEKFANDIGKSIEKIKSGDIGGGLEGIGSSIKAVMPAVKQFGDDLGTIFGDSQIGEDIGILTELIGGVGQGLQGIGQIASGDILGGITNLVSGLASIFTMSNAAAEKHRQALEAVMDSKIAQQREYNLLLLKQNLLYERGATVFGSDYYGKAINAIEVYKKALSDLNAALAGVGARKEKSSGKSLMDMLGLKEAQSGLKQIYAGLADIEIVTGHKKTGLFGWGKGKDTFSSVLDVYPELIRANGEFNKELAQTIISTRKMSEADKNALQNMVNLYEQYEEAMQSVRDYLTDIFGELGNTMSDALVDAFKNGTDAGEAFYKSVSEMLENLAQQMIYSVTLAPIMEKAQEQMLEIMKNGNLTDAEKFAQYADVLSNLTDEAITQQNNANDLLKLYQDIAAGKGFDIFKPDEEQREASKRGIATASQESVDENNGRLTTIQGHTFTIAECSKLLVGMGERILNHLAGIENNTSHCRRLENIENDMAEVRGNIIGVKNGIDTINQKGIILKR